MSLQYVSVDEADFSFGIDARSAENQIAPGFARDLLNADIIEKRARTRPGSQGYGGNLPVRVTALQYTDASNEVTLTLNGSIDLSAVRSTPLILFGKSSSVASGGPFTTAGDTAKYYPGFTVPTRKTMLASAGAPPYETLSIPFTEHDIASTDMFLAMTRSTDITNRSWELISNKFLA